MVAQKVIVLIFKKPKPTELKTARGRLMPPPIPQQHLYKGLARSAN